MKILPAYSFLNDLLTLASGNKVWPIDEWDCIGGRFSGKTFDTGAFITELCNLMREDKDEFVKASAIIYRKERKDRDDVWYQYNKFLNDTILEQNIEVSNVYFRWNFQNGNEVRFDYTQSKKTGKKYGKGKASISGDYIVIVLEEAGEFSPNEIMAILESMRGDNPNAQILLIALANPENPRNYFIKDCASLLTFNPETMSSVGMQYKLVEQQDEFGKPKRRLITYTNWRAIQKYDLIHLKNGGIRYLAKEPIYVSQDKLDFLVKQYKIDKLNALVADIGCPGSDFTAIYLRDMDKLKPAKYYQHECVSGGVDVGLGTADKSGKTCACFGAYDLQGDLDIYAEYVHDNKFNYKNPEQIADEIVQFYIKEIQRYSYFTGTDFDYSNPVYIKVDFSDKSFIRLLNQKAEVYGVDYFGFIECIKWEVNDRIIITQYLMKQGRIGINQAFCSNLLDEMAAAQWNEKGAKAKRKDDNDHSLNAMEYMMQDYMYNCIDSENKEFIYNKLSNRGKKRL